MTTTAPTLTMHPLATLDAAERHKTPDEIRAMTTRELIEWLRATPNRHGKKAHSLTEIASIAGASNGWPYFILHNKSSRSEKEDGKLHRHLRDYCEQLAAERLPSRHGTRVVTPGRLERVVVPWNVQKEPAVIAPPKETVVEPVMEPPRMEAAAPVAAPTPAAPPPPLEPALRNPAGFMAEFKEITDRLWAESEALDELAKATPAIFRPGIEKLRDDLLTVLSTMEG